MRNFKGLAVACAILLGGCSGDLYHDLAGPSEGQNRPDASTDGVSMPDLPVADHLVDVIGPDQSDAPADVGEVGNDQPLLPEADVVPPDVVMDDGMVFVDQLDAGDDVDSGVDVHLDDQLDVADVSDASPDILSDDHPVDTGVDAVDEFAHDAEVDVADAFVDGPDVLIDASGGDTGIDASDATVDIMDAATDAGVDAGDVGEAGEVFTGPPVIVDYNVAHVSDGTRLPSSGNASRLDYSFGLVRPMTTCAITHPSGDLSTARCTLVTISGAERAAEYLYLVVPGACGVDTDVVSCPSDWINQWQVTWFGRVYVASSTVSRESGTVPAFVLINRATCDAATGYNNPCIRFTIPL